MTRIQKVLMIALAWIYLACVAWAWQHYYGGLSKAAVIGLAVGGIAIAAIVLFSRFKPTGS